MPLAWEKAWRHKKLMYGVLAFQAEDGARRANNV